MLKIIEPWLFRRLERLHTLHRHQVVQQVQSRTICQQVVRFHHLVDSPSITQFSRKLLMHRIELEHQPLQTQVTQQHLPMGIMTKILELLMPMETFHLAMIRKVKNSNHHPVKVLLSLLKRRKTVLSVTTSSVSANNLMAICKSRLYRNMFLTKPFSSFRKITRIRNLRKSKNRHAHHYWRKSCHQDFGKGQNQR